MIEIITVTKDDLAGLVRTIDSTRNLREDFNIKQIIIDSSNEEISKNRSLVKQEKMLLISGKTFRYFISF